VAFAFRVSISKTVAAARSIPGCGVSTSATPNAFGAMNSEGFGPQKLLENEIHAATEHSEIVLRPIDHAEAQVVSPADVPRDSEFETSSELAEHFGFATEVIRLGMNGERVRRSLRVENIPFAAAENRSDTSPGVWRETCTGNWIPQRECS
jgi:hypothetical protein